MPGDFVVIRKGGIGAAVDAAILAQKGAASGIAPLGADSKVPAANSQVSSVAGRGGAVTLAAADVSGAVASTDPRLTDNRTPIDSSVTDAKVAAGAAIAESKLSLASDAVAGTPSRRTLGTGATQAAAGNDTRITGAEQTTNKNTAGGYPGIDAVPGLRDSTTALFGDGKYRSPTSVGTPVASPTTTGTVKGNVAASTPADPFVYFRSDPIWSAYTQGLGVSYVSAASVTIDTGAAWIPSLQRVIGLAAPVTLSAMTLTASTWYYLYLYDNAGTTAVEYSTVAPVNANDAGFTNTNSYPLRGAARVKGPAATPDFSRRYIGSVKSSATVNTLFNFRKVGARTHWLETVTSTPFRVANGITNSAAAATIDATAVVPPTSRVASMRLFHNGTAGTLQASNSETPGIFTTLTSGLMFVTEIPLDASRAFTIQFTVAPGGSGGFADVYSYAEAI